MSDAPRPDTQPDDSRETRNLLIGVGIGVLVVTIALVVLAVFLAANPETTAPGVEVVRDLVIIIMALELIVIGVAITAFFVQVARFINLLNNEVQPIITSTTDTLNTVRGTAIFLSRNLAEPVIAASSTLRGIGRVISDVEGIRKAAGIAMAAASAASPTEASATTDSGSAVTGSAAATDSDATGTADDASSPPEHREGGKEEGPEAGPSKSKRAKRKSTRKKREK